ncbi:YHS domain-containing protein [Microbaculum marinisediminis]|uniref:YHS domain-containing protein n=1 Tax=Microbaculum marinisediminis TaxID=2931392 RepID=A0AAW5QUA6_9HYPH|nr:YHS domain-containing protein [Microbaculum sp. A6E488]MCT8971520.1 YHS domain-containing protein [Microbaculum sp. A6E488]
MTVTDPVCGAQVDIDDVVAQADHDGWAYFFCSTRCHQRFRESPETYAEPWGEFPFSPFAKTSGRDHEKG